MNVPNRVKHFTWKACRNILATKENLWRRKVTQEGLCKECGNTTELATHLFWFCKQALVVWSHSKLVLPFTISQSWEFIEVMGQLLKWRDAYQDLMERVMMICLGIWRNRNEAKHGGKRKTGEAVMKCSCYLLEEFQTANEVRSKQEAQPQEVVRWTALKQGQYKVNYDAAVFTRSREVGFVVIIHDDAGSVVATLSKKRIGLTGVVEATAKAMEVAVQFVKDVGIREAAFEGDSLIVSKAAKGMGDVHSLIQNIVCGIIQDLQTVFIYLVDSI
ncbi:hypothetical protein CMV_004548 [Castanea mollissima]|uniref:GATA-type domain-containing protein n=1 Tax=Castanea mollissima TaxID=60419 RepID=A0A8J4W4V4_9ROSI|nr:hypothetical protein CMV_004548 [Castanea mollissima]